MNTSIEATLLWLSLTLGSVLAIYTLSLAKKISRKWYPDVACVYGQGFLTAVALACACLFLISIQ